MFLPRTAWTVLLSLSLTVGLPGVSLAETVLNAEQLETDGQQRLVEGETATAIKPLEAALSLYLDANDEEGVSRTAEMLWLAYGALGIEQELQGDTAAALDSFQRQLEFANLLQNPELLTQSYLNIGSSHLWLEHWTEARRWLNQGVDQARSLPANAPTVASGSLLERGLRLLLTLESVLNNAPKVIALADELMALSSSFETDFQVLQALGGAYLLQGNTTAAIDIAQDLMALAESRGGPFEEANALALMGEAQLMQRDIPGAIATLRQGLATGEQVDPFLAAQLQGSLGDAYAAAGEWESAFPLLMARVELERALGSNVGQAISLTNLGNLHILTENWIAAEEALSAAGDYWQASLTQVADPLQSIAFFDTQLVTYRNLQKALVAQERFDEALIVSEQGRAQVLTQQLAVQNIAADHTQTPTLEALQAIARQQNVTFVEYSLMPSSQEIFIPNRIDNQWLNTATDLYIWVVTPDGTLAFESVPLSETEQDLATAVVQTRQAMGVRGRAGAPPSFQTSQDGAELTEQLQHLHRLLIEPIAEHLPEDPDAPIVFVPQESLFLVPFAALQDDQGRYLIEKHTILTAPSIQSLALIQPKEDNLATVSSNLGTDHTLIVGNPKMPELADVALWPLPGAETEATAIAARLQTEPLLGAAATESAVREQLPTAKIVHLATHGLLDYGDPAAEIPGAIALAPDAVHDGLLTATELAAIPLQADLLVLSACDTGQGSITGDGVVGLARAAIAAGVPRLVVSLWAVPDQPTAQLMTAFYDELAQGQGTAQALRQAMLTTMQSHPDPKAWAAFTAIGLD